MASAMAADFALFASSWDTEDLDSSVGLGVKVDFGLGASPWAIELRVSHYPELGTNLGEFIDDVDPERVEVSATPVDLGAQVGLGANELFFISGGVSYVSIDTDRPLRIDEEVGWYLALGYRSCQDEGGLGFFAEVLYRGIEATAEGTIDDIQFFDIEGRLDGWAINVGVTWR